jgi:hypothetical protein
MKYRRYVPVASKGRYERYTECEIKAAEDQSYKSNIKQKMLKTETANTAYIKKSRERDHIISACRYWRKNYIQCEMIGCVPKYTIEKEL